MNMFEVIGHVEAHLANGEVVFARGLLEQNRKVIPPEVIAVFSEELFRADLVIIAREKREGRLINKKVKARTAFTNLFKEEV